MGFPQRALAFVAHPDDEAWLFGGTLATWAARGSEVRIVCATDGEKGVDRRGLATGVTQVGQLRRAELHASCQVLGVLEPVLLGLPDGGLSTFPVERGQALIRKQINEFAPDVVLTHGAGGDYGHLDHIALMQWVTEVYPGSWLVALPPDRMFGIWRKLRRFGFDGVVKGMTIDDFRGDSDITCELGLHARSSKKAALACHDSQLRDGDLQSFLAPGLLPELLSRECFVGGAQ